MKEVYSGYSFPPDARNATRGLMGQVDGQRRVVVLRVDDLQIPDHIKRQTVVYGDVASPNLWKLENHRR